MVGKRSIEPDDRMRADVGCSVQHPALLNVAPACIDCPDRIRDFLAHKIFIRGLSRAQGDISLSFGKIEIAIAHHKLDANIGIFLLKLL